MLSSLPYSKKNLGAPLQSRKAMLETLFRHLDMVRLSVGAIMVLTLVSCTGLIDGGSDGLSPQQRKAAKLWKESALPVLQSSCTGCHDGSRAMVGFLVGTTEAEIHDSVMKYAPPVVSTESPGDSRLLTKGLHDGPELTAEQLPIMLQWIQAEREAEAHDPLNPQPTLAVPAFAVQLCPAGTLEAACPINHASLEAIANVGALTPGAEISFVARGLDTGMFLTSIKLNGGTMGANIEHPLFISLPPDKGTPVPDQLDRFYNLKMNEKAGGSDPLGIGSAEFEGFLPANMLEIRFKVVKAFQPDTAKPMTGCKAVTMFKPVATALQASCTSCHANNGSGQGALDMTGVNSADPAVLLTACNQALTRVDLTTPAKSLIETAPDPASGVTHPLKLPAATFATFKSSVDTWILAEKAAP